jgi:hypothetical protein
VTRPESIVKSGYSLFSQSICNKCHTGTVFFLYEVNQRLKTKGETV